MASVWPGTDGWSGAAASWSQHPLTSCLVPSGSHISTDTDYRHVFQVLHFKCILALDPNALGTSPCADQTAVAGCAAAATRQHQGQLNS